MGLNVVEVADERRSTTGCCTGEVVAGLGRVEYAAYASIEASEPGFSKVPSAPAIIRSPACGARDSRCLISHLLARKMGDTRRAVFSTSAPTQRRSLGAVIARDSPGARPGATLSTPTRRYLEKDQVSRWYPDRCWANRFLESATGPASPIPPCARKTHGLVLPH